MIFIKEIYKKIMHILSKRCIIYSTISYYQGGDLYEKKYWVENVSYVSVTASAFRRI